MPITKQKRNKIKKEAAVLSQQIPSAEGAKAFEEDYGDIMTALNEKLEDRLDKFRSEAIPILREAYPSRPSGILSVISEETEALRDLAQSILVSMEKVRYAGFRMCAAECLKNIIDICTNTIAESQNRAQLRNKMLQQ